MRLGQTYVCEEYGLQLKMVGEWKECGANTCGCAARCTFWRLASSFSIWVCMVLLVAYTSGGFTPWPKNMGCVTVARVIRVPDVLVQTAIALYLH